MVPIGRRHCSRPSSIFGRRAEGNFGLPFSDSARANKRLLLTIMERKTCYHVKLDDIIVDYDLDTKANKGKITSAPARNA
jgi:hypothetical protein